jgi:tRNA (cytidine32/uridine32-2'-O)-methyltransferase
MLDRIRIVMVNTSHAGNIGSAARAMKTMGLRHLWLVDPVEFPGRRDRAEAMASGAIDVLADASVVSSLDDAIAGCSLVLGASARQRRIPWPHFDAEKGAALALAQSVTGSIAILFGREQSGLTNDELHRCHAHIEIPGNPEYPVLNVAAAIQVICYELRRQWLKSTEGNKVFNHQMPVELVRWDDNPASSEKLEQFFVHCEQALLDIGFFEADTPKKLMARVRRFFLRARPDERELRMLRGILASAQSASRRLPIPSARIDAEE